MKSPDTLMLERFIKIVQDQTSIAELWCITLVYKDGDRNASMSFSLHELRHFYNMKAVVESRFEAMIDSIKEEPNVPPSDG